MINKKIDDFFVNFADDLAENILESSDEEIISWAKENYSDPDTRINSIKSDIHSLIMKNRKEKILNPAKEEYEQSSTLSNLYKKLLNKSSEGLKDLFDSVISKSSAVPDKFVVACRNKDNLSEKDILGLLEDMYDLGLINEDDI